MSTVLRDDQPQTVANALRVAAEVYRFHAAVERAEGDEPGHQRVAEQFDRQAADCTALAERFEDAFSVTLN